MLQNIFMKSETRRIEDDKLKEEFLSYIKRCMPDLEFVDFATSYSVITFRFRPTDPRLIEGYLKPNMRRVIDAILDSNGSQVMQDGNKLIITAPRSNREVMYLGNGIDILSEIPKKDDVICYVGECADGTPAIVDFDKDNHILIAGQIGSGKSTCIHAMILSMMTRYGKDEVVFYLLDPKADLTRYTGIPSVIEAESEKGRIAFTIERIVEEMTSRQQEMRSMKLKDWNAKYPGKAKPHIVVFFDEIDSVISRQYKDDVSESIRRFITKIAKEGRSAGIHLILASQRPVKVNLDTSIKSEIKGRIALKLDTSTDSRIMLNESGAEKLRGNGDAFITGGEKPKRMQVAYVEWDEVEKAIEEMKKG